MTADALPYVRTSDRPETDETETDPQAGEDVSHAHAARGHRDKFLVVQSPERVGVSRFER